MKTKHILNHILPAALLFLAVPAYAQDDHKGHDHVTHKETDSHGHAKKITGPNGGRILTKVEPHLEFFVAEDRTVKITAVDAEGRPVAMAEQTVSIIAGDRANPTRMSFTKDGESLVSDTAFPEGNDLPVVIQIKVTPDAKTVIEKFNLNLNNCPTCSNKEYACTCEHGSEAKGHEGHEH